MNTTNCLVVESYAADPRYARAIRAIAKSRGLSISALMRQIVFEFVARERRKKWADRALQASANALVAPTRRVVVPEED